MTQQPLITAKIPLCPELPGRIRAHLAGRPVAVARFPRQVRLRLRQPDELRVSECAEKYRIVTGVDSDPGPWRNEQVPHTVEPMNTYALAGVKEVWLCWPERAAKTNTMLNCMSWSVRHRPGNIFWLDPAEDDAGKNLKTKIIPLFRSSREFSRYLSTKADDTGKSLIAFAHGIFLFPAHANSARSMANFFGMHNFGNEVDKYPPTTGPETDPINLIRKRGRDKRGSKFMFSSTPAGRFIYKGTYACNQVKQLRNRCPHCGEYILMDDEHLVIPGGATPEQVESGDAEVGYICNHCGVIWSETDRAVSYQQSRWFIVKGESVRRPVSVGFHATALCFPMIPLAEYCGKFLRAKSGDLAAKIDYVHGYRVENYEADLSDRKEDHVLALVDPHLPQGVIPPDTAAIIIKADTQKHGFMYQVLAVGYAPHCAPALVDHGFVESFEALNEIRDREYMDADGTAYSPHAGLIDSGGGTNPFNPKHSRTSEVYEFCRLNKFWRPVKGRRDQATPWTTTRLDYYPSRDGKKKPIPGGLTLYVINVTHYKNQLATKLEINPGDPGAIRLHAGLLADGPHSGQKYAAQLCAEYRDERGYWECPRGKQNHFWDCWVYGFAAMDILGVRRKTKSNDTAAGQQRGRRIYSQGVD